MSLSQPLRIGVVGPPWIPVPPPAYGGIEEVLAGLCAGLASRGHEVTLVAASGSSVQDVRVLTPLGALPGRIGQTAPELEHCLAAAEILRDADVVLDHSGALGALLLPESCPVIHVAHGPLTEPARSTYRAVVRRRNDITLVALSQAQQALAPELPWAGVCHNGVDVDAIRPGTGAGGYLAFLGRIAPEKGPAEAIAIARRCGRPLVMAAKCREPSEREHFAHAVAPHLGTDVVWLGEIGHREKMAMLRNAAALVFPISWPEPFGMVMIEAMACGTPVMATPCGAVPEVVREGVSGVVRETPEALGDALDEALAVPREWCRAYARDRFSIEAMVEGYERVVARVLAAGLEVATL